MPDATWPRIKDEHAKDVCARIELDAEALALLTDAASPRAYFRTLREAGFIADALRFLAMALDSRDAVWWACRAARASPPKHTDPRDAKCVGLAEEWVLEPNEQRGRDAYALTEDLQHKSPGAWCAAAAFWAGPNIAPQLPDTEISPTAPPAHLYAAAVAASLLTTIGAGEPADIVRRQAATLDLGERVAAGKDSWKDASR